MSEFKETKGEWYKMNAERIGGPFIIVSNDETIFQCYGDDAEYNAQLASCSREMLEILSECLDTFTCEDSTDRDLKDRIELLIKKATLCV